MQTKYLSNEEALIRENEQLIAWQEELIAKNKLLQSQLEIMIKFMERQSGAKHRGALWFYREFGKINKIFSVEADGKIVDRSQTPLEKVCCSQDTTPAA